MKKKVIIITTLVLLMLILSMFLTNYLLINNFTKYNSSLTIDKENNILYTNTKDEIKILQISDVQLDEYKEKLDGFVKIKKIIKKTNPDLIVLTGDNLDNSADESYVISLASFMDSFQIPWAPIYGNHDHWAKVSIHEQNKIYEKYEYCLFKTGEIQNSHGNYYYTIKYQNEAIYSLIFMDSEEKGFVDEHTIWYENIVNKINQENNRTIPNMVFCHIPIPELSEAYEAYQLDNSIGSGSIKESLSLQEKNVGIFDKMLELKSTKVVAFGHDHINTLHIKYKDIMFCYGLKIGYSSYYDKDIQGGVLYKITNNKLSIDKISI